MKKLTLLLVGLIAVGAALFAWQNNLQDPVSQQPATNEPAPQPPTPTPEAPSEPVPAPTVYYPVPNYAARITHRAHGQYFTADNPGDVACGGKFNGYHAGDDLEVTAGELTPEVPIFAIADGKVRQLSAVNGYGGLLVIEYTINGQTMTANYGHADLNQPKVAVGQAVTAGQIVGYLGAHCSAETDGERKHLHFALHKGSAIDVKGYLQTEAELANWLNPAEFLKALGAAEPKA